MSHHHVWTTAVPPSMLWEFSKADLMICQGRPHDALTEHTPLPRIPIEMSRTAGMLRSLTSGRSETSTSPVTPWWPRLRAF